MRYRETKATQRLPVNLYETTNGKGSTTYYRYKHPITKKFHGMGSDKQKAVAAAKTLNDKLTGATSLVDSVLHPSTSVASLCDSYLAYKKNLPGKKALSKASINEIRGAHKKIKAYFDGWGCNQLTTMVISQFLDGIFDPVENEGTARERDKTRKQFVALCKYGQTRGELDQNPADPCLVIGKPPEVERHTLDGWKAIYNAAEPWMKKAMDICILTTQRRGDICNMERSNIKDGVLYIVQEKTQKYDTGYLAINITPELDEVLNRSLGDQRVNIVSPYLIHRKPKNHTARKKASGQHFSFIDKDYLTKEFKRLRDDVTGFYGDLPLAKRPGFHQGRALAIHLHKKQGCSPQELAGHASEFMTNNYDARHEDINWVNAELGGFSLAKAMG
jgi:enterobacteria phage integrase